ncbi:hypothetical protein LTR10_014902 [Elasticomyces elasticus]|uniref:Uncharacterized protein n=1 Tax=Exophiala sideris TaxID=1016849 RepID=A0ABR0JG94_9EURO|nr:hypothetical protein LTR10_014902 [Elasticomyces elasticus]KAK5025746.1 hypothetical protein LTS07_007950 [Exophiala sideris]KAK5033046.1 hypothetical protein LTR13_007011 [Exophiala sideris]KAK5063531.1 hypothetical protein LTR69_004237 [Exophiala sideris]KAK5180637.1 hypothetical protein LTR44_006951 [Eurotiomycetes sp. CCFEE 6388]
MSLKGYFEDRDVLITFGDILAGNLKRVKNLQRPEGSWWKDASWVQANWQVVWEYIHEENEQVATSGTVTKPLGKHPELGGVKWEVQQAAAALSIKPKELEWEIQTYAERNHMAHLGIEELARVGNFREVAHILASLMEKLEFSLSVTPEAKGHHKEAVVRYQKTFFESISYRDFYRTSAVPDYVVNDAMKPRYTACIEAQNKRLEEDEEAARKKQEDRQRRIDHSSEAKDARRSALIGHGRGGASYRGGG